MLFTRLWPELDRHDQEVVRLGVFVDGHTAEEVHSCPSSEAMSKPAITVSCTWALNAVVRSANST